jgi:hypothetical protein
MRPELDGGTGVFYGFYPSDQLQPRLTWIQGSPRRWLRRVARAWRSLKFIFHAIRTAQSYDIIHIHSLWRLAKYLPFKKRVIEFHGDDVRRSPTFQSASELRAVHQFIASTDIPLLVSTPDLLTDVPTATVLPNPVDDHHFTRTEPYTPRTAFYNVKWHDTEAFGCYGQACAARTARRLSAQLTVRDRRDAWIPYATFPAYLQQFEFFIDRFGIPSLSKTALEALALGVKVIAWNGTIHDGLPPEHAPEQVAQHSIHIYEELS